MDKREEFITKANIKHNNKYDYSKVEYINSRTNVIIICPKHGEFKQKPNNHIQGCGCPKCKYENTGNRRRLTIEEFIEKAKKIHGDKYDYSKVEYVNNQTKVCIICPEHGEFWQIPNNHIRGNGCPLCAKQNDNAQQFIEKAKKIHGDKYDYSKVKYVNNNTKVCIICPEHGEFWQTPKNHLKGYGYRNPSFKLRNKEKKQTTEYFIKKAMEIHGNKYDYSKKT